jgi:hypothetical protein
MYGVCYQKSGSTTLLKIIINQSGFFVAKLQLFAAET